MFGREGAHCTSFAFINKAIYESVINKYSDIDGDYKIFPVKGCLNPLWMSRENIEEVQWCLRDIYEIALIRFSGCADTLEIFDEMWNKKK